MVKVKPAIGGQIGDTTAVREYIEHHFPGARLKEEHYGELHFQVRFIHTNQSYHAHACS